MRPPLRAPRDRRAPSTPRTPRPRGLSLAPAAAPARRLAPAGERGPPAVALRRRAAPFAAIIPGDSVVETVFATGLFNFM